LLVVSGDTVWQWDLSPEARRPEELVELARVLCGPRIRVPGAVLLPEAGDLPRMWQAVRAKYPAEFSAPLDVLAWHRREAEEAEQLAPRTRVFDGAHHTFSNRPELFAALFHVDQLLAAEPDSAPLRLRRARLLARLRQSDGK
jgi:hypothetical protein